MSNSGSLPIKDSVFTSGHCKKPKKKRHRNKFRNSSCRKKFRKKFYSVRKPCAVKSNCSKLNSDSKNIMSNWYWSNYKKAVEWQDRHKIAHWKACALALLEENRYLLQIINEMQPGVVPGVSVTLSNIGEHSNFNREELNVNSPGCFSNIHIARDDNDQAIDDDDDDDDDEDDIEGKNENEDASVEEEEDDIEFEMSEEMMQFFEQSYRHKMDMKKLKEKELLNKVEDKIKQMQTNKIKRSTEMSQLYGDGASMIIGMETAVQLSFDKYCDTKSPKYWPNIPFRL